MSRQSLAIVLVGLLGCRSASGARELPVGHPADPAGAFTEFEPALNPFAVTPTFSTPTAPAAEHFMAGSPHGAALPGLGSGGDESASAGAEGEAGPTYTCPMHPEVVRASPGKCPECGMALRPVVSHSSPGDDEGSDR